MTTEDKTHTINKEDFLKKSIKIDSINQFKLQNGDNIISYVSIVNIDTGLLILNKPFKINIFLTPDNNTSYIALHKWFEFGNNETVLLDSNSIISKSSVTDSESINRYLEACKIFNDNSNNFTKKDKKNKIDNNIINFPIDPKKIN